MITAKKLCGDVSMCYGSYVDYVIVRSYGLLIDSAHILDAELGT